MTYTQQLQIHLELITTNLFEPSINIINPHKSVFLNKNINDKSFFHKTWSYMKPNEEYKLNTGDIIKLGRVRLKIDAIHLSNNNTNIKSYKENITATNFSKTNNTFNESMFCGRPFMNNNKLNHNSSINIDTEQSVGKQAQPMIIEPQTYCRICYRSESDLVDPLISPCKCSGSMSYIHYKCLKKSIDVKLSRKEDQKQIFLQWNNFECEICKVEYPKYLKYKNSLYSLIDFNIPFNDFIICDFLLYDDMLGHSTRKGIIVISFDNDNEMLIGRNQNNDIVLKDISVSRNHCALIKKQVINKNNNANINTSNNGLYIVDKRSKFGTMLYLKNDINLNWNNNDLNLCSGKHFFNISLKRSWSWFTNLFQISCCRCHQSVDSEYVVGVDISNMHTNNNKCITEQIDNKHIEGRIIDKDAYDSYEDYVMDINDMINSTININNQSNKMVIQTEEF